MYINTKEHQFDMELELLALEGMHNVYNSLASGIVAKLMDISDEQLRSSLADFQGCHIASKGGNRTRCAIYQRLKSHQCELLLVCASKHANKNSIDSGWYR